jgi:hypothetical protein
MFKGLLTRRPANDPAHRLANRGPWRDRQLCTDNFAPTPSRRHLRADTFAPTPSRRHLRADTFAPTPSRRQPSACAGLAHFGQLTLIVRLAFTVMKPGPDRIASPATVLPATEAGRLRWSGTVPLTTGPLAINFVTTVGGA